MPATLEAMNGGQRGSDLLIEARARRIGLQCFQQVPRRVAVDLVEADEKRLSSRSHV
jgi:hypothetical protein